MSKTLLMIHGVGCGGEVWDRMKRDFTMAGWTCETPTLFPDLRTHDDPPAGLADLTLQNYADAAAEMASKLTERDGEKPVIIGHSMGGMIAQRLAEAGQVRGAIFLTPAQPKGCSVTDLRVVRTFWSVVITGQKSVPTLTIGAKKDRATVIKAVRKVGDKYAGAAVPGDYFEYANHGHWIVDEPGTEQVSADILGWLDEKL